MNLSLKQLAAARLNACQRTSRDWHQLTVWAAAAATTVDALLLQRKYGFFTGGFLANARAGTVLDGVAFLAALLALNIAIAAPLGAVTLAAAGALGLHRRAARFSAFAVALLPLVATNFLFYEIWTYLGDSFDFQLMLDLTGRRMSELFAVAAPFVARPLSLGLLLCAVVAASTWVVQRWWSDLTERPAVPPSAFALRRCVLLWTIGAAVVTFIAITSEPMASALARTPSGLLFSRSLNALSDVDGDGFGFLRNPRDNAPFDRDINPYAIDQPGNGIDEDGLAGDLPVTTATQHETPDSTADWADRPPVVLIVLESFRADAVGAIFRGRPVTPALDALAREGVSVANAWSHNGFTAQSRFHILAGSLVPCRDSSSVLDDFKRQGYEVAYFSGQDDSFGDMQVRYDQVDTYYDARRDVTNRYTTYSTPGSLAVPFDIVEMRIREFLDRRNPARPLFLYVNFHDTHYPYTHSGIQNILGVESLAPPLISPRRRSQLRETYLNTASNVDAAIARTLQAVEAKTRRKPAVIVTSDHGESLFDGGFLGHGHSLNDVQTRIPLIIRGLPIRLRTPVGQVELRHAINEALSGASNAMGRPVIENGRNTRVFQYLGTLERPGQIAWLSAFGRFIYDFRLGRVWVWDGWVAPSELTDEPLATFNNLAHTWERMRLARQVEQAPDARDAKATHEWDSAPCADGSQS